jgi:dTDP-4-dehydrorhamnose 3,5-epimerase
MTMYGARLSDCTLISPTVHNDDRGCFFEAFNAKDLASFGIVCTFVQDNHSCSKRGVLRGLHYQLGRPQSKLIRVVRGEIFDVAIDVRLGSPTFGQAVFVRLSAENRIQLFIPEGFAHGFYALEDTEVVYKCSDYYAPKEERGIIWNDNDLGIQWPISEGPILSEKDRSFYKLADVSERDLPVYRP